MIFILDLTISDKQIIDISYKSFLVDLKSFLQQSSEKDSLNYVKMIIDRLHKGQFSMSDAISFDSNYKYLFLPSITSNGVYVMSGVWCCRHASALMKDLLDILGFNSTFMYIFIDEHCIWHRADRKNANHVTLLFEYEGNYYVVDAYNKFILKVCDSSNLIPLDIKPYDTLPDYENSNIENIGKILKKYYVYRNLGIEHVYDYNY